MPRQPLDRATSTRRYMAEIRRYPLLTAEQERDLAEDLKVRREAAIERLVQSNLSFVVKMAWDYRHLSLPFEDLVNEGNVGLLEAARRYDGSRGARFISYAIWWIRKRMLQAASENSTQVHWPAYQRRQSRRSEIAARPREPRERVEKMLSHSVREVSLSEPAGLSDGSALSDRLADPRAGCPERDLVRSEHTRLLRRSLQLLRPQERQVLEARYGFDGGRSRTLREVGAVMNLSRERVRQIEMRALARIRALFRPGSGAGGGQVWSPRRAGVRSAPAAGGRAAIA